MVEDDGFVDGNNMCNVIVGINNNIGVEIYFFFFMLVNFLYGV